MKASSDKKHARYEARLGIPVIYRTQFFTTFFFGYVTAQVQLESTVRAAILSFQSYMGLEEEDSENLYRLYLMKKKQFLEGLHSDNGVVFMLDSHIGELETRLNSIVEQLDRIESLSS